MVERVHKNSAPTTPRLSFILLDWGCRERFTTLDWLNKQDIPRDQYELIWVELYDRVMDEVMEKADVVITCNQSGTYHKHLGYNIGLLQARGDLICVCDSDAVFPADFVRSVFRSFGIDRGDAAQPLVLMHYEWRTSLLYPDGLSDAEDLKDAERWQWWPLIVNEGACVTVRREDAVRFGGFDEHPSYVGYLCGPYDLAWRLVNAGWPEIWHDSSVALWHFAHPDPIGTNGQKASLKQLLEKAYPHIHGHALTAVEAFSVGRFQPLQENPKIWALRMQDRHIGSELESRYADLTGQDGYSSWAVLRLWLSLISEIIDLYLKSRLWDPMRKHIHSLIGERAYLILRAIKRDFVTVKRINHTGLAETPTLLCSHRDYNIVKFKDSFYAAPYGIGELDLTTTEGRCHPELLVSGSYSELVEQVKTASKGYWRSHLWRLINGLLGERVYRKLDAAKGGLAAVKRTKHTGPAEIPILLCSYRGYNIVKFEDSFYAAPYGIGELDLTTVEGRGHPELLVSGSYSELVEQVKTASKGYWRSHLWRLINGLLGERVYRKLDAAKGGLAAVKRTKHTGPAEIPILLCSYRGYNIVKFEDSFYAAPYGIGELDLTTVEGRGHPELLVSGSYSELVEQVKTASKGYWRSHLWRLINGLLGERVYRKLDAAKGGLAAVKRTKHTGPAEIPILLCSYRGYNIVKFEDSFYAAPYGIGDLDLTTEEGRHHPELLVSGSYSELVEQVKTVSKGYWRSRFRGLVRRPINSLLGERVYRKLDAAKGALAAVKRTSHTGPAEIPTLLRSYRGYNIVKFKGSFYAAPRVIGDLDLTTEEGRHHPELLVSGSYSELVEQVKTTSKSYLRSRLWGLTRRNIRSVVGARAYSILRAAIVDK